MTNYAEYALVRGMSYLADSQAMIAHNLANLETKGFKRREAVAAEGDMRFESALGRQLGTISFGQQTDWTPGTPMPSSNNLDVALAESTALRVRDDQGRTFYTRDGRLQFDPQGFLSTASGLRVLDESGMPVQINPDEVSPTELAIDPDGTMHHPETGESWGPIGIYALPRDEQIQPAGRGLFVDHANRAPQLQPGGLQSGYTEASNVDSMQEMVQMMIVQRSFTATQRALGSVGRMQDRLVEHANR